MNTKLLAVGAIACALTGCEMLSPFVGDDLKTAMCDRDGDGHGRMSAYCGGDDCDDEDAQVGVLTWYVDGDDDGYGATGGIVQCEQLAQYTTRAGDCDDTNPAINPIADEVCDEIDNDCNELMDELDNGLVDGLERFEDLDEDGWGGDTLRVLCEEEAGWIAQGGDCDDSDATINPDVAEVCADGIDQNCNGITDDDAVDMPWYRDVDEDGYGNASDSVLDCAQPNGFVANDTDCDDAEFVVNPGVEETCNNGVDDNCDGSANQCELPLVMSLSQANTAYTGELSNDSLGRPVAGGCDVNNDGHDDVLAGAYGDDVPPLDVAGAAYLLYGPIDEGEWSIVVADVKFVGESDDDKAGLSISCAGDVNNDGFDDVLIGAPQNDSAGNNAGATYLFYGPIEIGEWSLAMADVKFVGEEAGDQAGFSICASDVNNDGYDDVVIGAPQNDSEGNDVGAVYLFYGPIEIGEWSLATADVKFEGESNFDKVGFSISCAGDVNNDGFDDVLIGAPQNDSAGNNAGAAYLFYSPIEIGEWSLATADVKFVGEEENDQAGFSICTSSDVNNDGFDDVFIGAFNHGSEPFPAGAAYLFYGPPDNGQWSLATADVKFVGETQNNQAGFSLGCGCDVNNDGFDDVLIGAPQESSVWNNAGATYLFYGSIEIGQWSLATADVKFVGEEDGDRAGISVAFSDLNNDGYDDVIIGAQGRDTPPLDGGTAYIVFILDL